MLLKIFYLFLGWRLILFLIAFLAIFFIPTLGNRFPYADSVLEITKLPSWIWGFGNFDGVHYLRIAQNGYGDEYTQAFFPIYPYLIDFVTNINILIPLNPHLDNRIFVDPAYFINGLIVTNLIFIVGLFFAYKLYSLDFSEKVSFKSLLLLISLPTAFYFGSIYTESLFITLLLMFIFFLRKKYYFLAGLIGGFASATKIVGVLLILVYLIEISLMLKKDQVRIISLKFIKMLIGLFIIPLGLLSYMWYLKISLNDPLYFFNAQAFFGAERSETIILLPQVLFRYFKIISSLPIFSYEVLIASTELIFTLIPLFLLILLYKKIRFSYWVFALASLLVPTLSGSLSSMPRYVLVSLILILPILVNMSDKYYKYLIAILILIQILFVSLFTRGYWIA